MDAGGLMAYGVSYPETYRRAATDVDKIFKGAKLGQYLRDPGVERWHGARLLGCAGGHWYVFVHRHGRPMRICRSLISSSLAPMKARMVCHSNLPSPAGPGGHPGRDRSSRPGTWADHALGASGE